MSPRSLAVVIVACVLAHAAPLFAFCGFYVAGGDAKLFNEATQVVLMRHGNETALSMQNNYEGPPGDFAMVIPVPQVLQKENVKTLPKAVFDTIDTLTAPRLVEYWEMDPCYVEPDYERVMESAGAPPTAAPDDEGGVKIEAQFKVGEYDIVVLSAKESTSLDKYLRQEKYNIPQGAEPYFKPYIEAGMYFFVAKVDSKRVKYDNGRAVLSPLRFDYESTQFQLPIRLGMINSKGKQDLLVYILAQNQRYEVANYENAFIPTNIEVRNDVRNDFGGFYRALFDRTTEQQEKAVVVTEYSWDASTCDPCPGPMLSAEDYLTLGADALGAPQWGWVVTRLHARYTKDDIGEDLVFQAAPPVGGGREWHDPKTGALEQATRPSDRNMFQGRYIIRHEWTGEAKCDNPVYGRWGGPNGAGSPTTGAAPSANTEGRAPALEPAAEIELASLVKQEIPELKLKPDAAPEAQKPAAKPATGSVQTSDPEKKNRCTIARVGGRETASPAWFVALLGMFVAFTRRRSF